MFSYDCMRILLMMLDCAVVHSTATWVSNSLEGRPFVCNLGLQSFKGTYLATVLQSWFIGVRFFKAEICPGSHSLRGYQWSLKDSGARVRTRIARGMIFPGFWISRCVLCFGLGVRIWRSPSTSNATKGCGSDVKLQSFQLSTSFNTVYERYHES